MFIAALGERQMEGLVEQIRIVTIWYYFASFCNIFLKVQTTYHTTNSPSDIKGHIEGKLRVVVKETRRNLFGV
jgi:hypothetical protein